MSSPATPAAVSLALTRERTGISLIAGRDTRVLGTTSSRNSNESAHTHRAADASALRARQRSSEL